MLRIAFCLMALLAGCEASGPPSEAHAGIVVFDSDEARREATIQALAGDSGSAYALAIDKQEQRDSQGYREWLSIASSRGWGPAMRDYGTLLLEGDECDAERGRRLLRLYISGDVGSGPGAREGEVALLERRLTASLSKE